MKKIILLAATLSALSALLALTLTSSASACCFHQPVQWTSQHGGWIDPNDLPELGVGGYDGCNAEDVWADGMVDCEGAINPCALYECSGDDPDGKICYMSGYIVLCESAYEILDVIPVEFHDPGDPYNPDWHEYCDTFNVYEDCYNDPYAYGWEG